MRAAITWKICFVIQHKTSFRVHIEKFKNNEWLKHGLIIMKCIIITINLFSDIIHTESFHANFC